jgi:hypothetical protein
MMMAGDHRRRQSSDRRSALAPQDARASALGPIPSAPWNDPTDPSAWVVNVALVARDHVQMHVLNDLTRSTPQVDSEVERRRTIRSLEVATKAGTEQPQIGEVPPRYHERVAGRQGTRVGKGYRGGALGMVVV